MDHGVSYKGSAGQREQYLDNSLEVLRLDVDANEHQRERSKEANKGERKSCEHSVAPALRDCEQLFMIMFTPLMRKDSEHKQRHYAPLRHPRLHAGY